MIREIRESVASRMFSIELSVTVGKKKKNPQVLFITGDHFITPCTSGRKCVAFKTNGKSIDLLAWGSRCVYDF